MWYIHTIDYYLAIKGNEVLIHATMWSNHFGFSIFIFFVIDYKIILLVK